MDTMPIADWARAMLEQLGMPPAARMTEHVDELVMIWRRVLEAALVEHYTIPELGALARFYATPEGASVFRKLVAFQTATTPALAAEIVSWARTVTARVRAPSSSDMTP
jgi:hypothetical protein